MMYTSYIYPTGKILKGVLTNMKFKKVLLPFFAGALALSLAACSGDDKEKEDADDQAAFEEMQKKLDEQKIDEEKIVAVINDEEVNGETYNVVLQNLQMQFQQIGQDPTSDEVAKALKEQTLDTLVNQTLLLQKAKAENIEVAQDEIDNEYNLFIEKFGDEDTLKKALDSEGMKPEDLKTQISDSIAFDKYQEKVAPAEDVTEEEIQAYYDDFVAQSEGDEEVPPLEEISESIEQILLQDQQQQKMMAHLEELKKDAKIELKI